MPTTAREAGHAAQEARDHPVLEWGARVGFVVYGVVYGVLAWLTAQVALGGGHSASVSRQGALQEVARQPLGGTLLWIAFAGFCALVLWEAATAIGGHRDRDGAKRVLGRIGSAAKAVVFIAFAVSTAKVALGSGSHRGTASWTAWVLRLPGGPVLVGAVGLGVLGYGGYSVYKGLGDRWRKELDPDGKRGELGAVVTVLARVGFPSRGLAFGIIGCLLVWAAFTEDPHHSGGLDRALMRLRHAPYGGVLLVLIAVGFACFGLYNIAKAWHLRRR